jgi:DNA (cytosine-5)-methyltransferase 1
MEKYRFIDLFSGIGGIRMGLEQTGRFECVKSYEINKKACDTYEANFGDNPFGDVTKIDADSLPKFDFIAGGFPCQSFSMAGWRLGFDDTRGTLFFEVAKLIKKTRPLAVLLENVRGLTNHDGGRTLAVILNVLRNDLGYATYSSILNAKDFGVPQNRERIYIAAFSFVPECDFDAFGGGFSFPTGNGTSVTLRKFLESNVESNFYLSQKYMDGLKNHRKVQEEKGRGFGYEILDRDGIANAIVCGGMGRERNLIRDEPVGEYPADRNTDRIRMLTPRECARLQGFPDSFKTHPQVAAAYRQFGNSVAVPVIRAIAERMAVALDKHQGIMSDRQ